MSSDELLSTMHILKDGITSKDYACSEGSEDIISEDMPTLSSEDIQSLATLVLEMFIKMPDVHPSDKLLAKKQQKIISETMEDDPKRILQLLDDVIGKYTSKNEDAEMTDDAEVKEDAGDAVMTEDAEIKEDAGDAVMTEDAEIKEDAGDAVMTEDAEIKEDAGDAVMTEDAEVKEDAGDAVMTEDAGDAVMTEDAWDVPGQIIPAMQEVFNDILTGERDDFADRDYYLLLLLIRNIFKFWLIFIMMTILVGSQR